MIYTERLAIRHITPNDWQSIQAIWKDVNASQFARYDKPHETDSDDVRQRIARWAEASMGIEHIFFAICLQETVIGYIAFNIRDKGYEIGYCFHSDYHGKGYARESLSALIDYIKTLGAIQLTVGTALNNTPSVKLVTSLGFKLIEVETVSFYKDKNGEDIVFEGGIYKMLL